MRYAVPCLDIWKLISYCNEKEQLITNGLLCCSLQGDMFFQNTFRSKVKLTVKFNCILS